MFLVLNEAQIQAEFYYSMKCLGFREIYLQVKLPSRVHRSRAFTADAAMFWQNNLVCLVEFKKSGSARPKVESRQYQAYAGTGRPFFTCVGIDELPYVLEQVVDLLKLAGWKPKHELML